MSLSNPLPIATVIITTRNRRDMLRRAVQSAVSQEGDIEVLVVDDASTDGTCEMLRQEFPTVRVEARTEQAGYIAQRNRAFRLARGPIVVTIDDDAVFSTSKIVQQAVGFFDNPRIGALALAFANFFDGVGHPWYKDIPDVSSATYTFIGTASAIRRELFLKVDGYREVYRHWTEEVDFCLKLLNQGYFVRFAPADLIHHFPDHTSRNSDNNKLVFRNRILAIWFNAPAIMVVPLLTGTCAKSVFHGLRTGNLKTVVTGLVLGLVGIFREREPRKPVSMVVYRAFSKLRRKMIPISELEKLIPVSVN